MSVNRSDDQLPPLMSQAEIDKLDAAEARSRRAAVAASMELDHVSAQEYQRAELYRALTDRLAAIEAQRLTELNESIATDSTAIANMTRTIQKLTWASTIAVCVSVPLSMAALAIAIITLLQHH